MKNKQHSVPSEPVVSPGVLKTVALTPRQELIWVEDALHPGVPANHVLTLMWIGGSLDVTNFERAFRNVVARCDALRMRVMIDGGKRYGVVGLEATAPLLDVRDLTSEPQPEQSARRVVEQLCRKPFEEGGSLLRATLLRVAAGRFLFAVDQHHSITDSQSCRLLHGAIEQAYLGRDPRVQGDIAAAIASQSEYYRSSAGREAARFWEEHLAGTVERGRLYGRGSRSKVAATRRVSRNIDWGTADALQRRVLGHPPSHVLTAAVAAWLCRVTATSDVVFGVPLLNRQSPFESAIGLFMEICPNRLEVHETDTFLTILEKVRSEAALVRAHRRYPISGRLAGYEVLLNVHPPALSSFAGLDAQYELTTPLSFLDADEFAADASPWEMRESLTIQVGLSEGKTPMTIAFDGNVGVFNGDLLDRAIDHFVSLLRQCVACPAVAIGRTELLTDQERAIQSLSPGVAAAAMRDVQSLPVAPTVALAHAAEAEPGRIAVRHRETDWTYAMLWQRVKALSACLVATGVEPGDRVGVCMDRSPDLLATLLAVHHAGAAFVPVDPGHPRDRLRLILEDAKPRLLLVDANGESLLQGENTQSLRVDLNISATGSSCAADQTNASGVAYVIFTSGSTGRPKGVQVTHHGLATFLAAMRECPGIGRDDRVLALTTIAFDIAVLELFLPLTVGAMVVIADRSDAVDPAALDRLLDKNQVTVMQATPTTWHMLLGNDWSGRQGMRALVGGEMLTPELAEELIPRTAALWNMYGPTETTVWSTCARVTSAARPISIGRPIRGTTAYVLNSLFVPQPIGVPGELYIGGDGVAAGYLGRPDLTEERFVADMFASQAGARMYRTGDVVRVLEDGRLEYLGRRDSQVKIRGYRIELGEIESILEGHPGVAQAVVVVRGSSQSDMTLCGCIKSAGVDLDMRTLEAHARRKLPSYMVPAHFMSVVEFPLTSSGKIDRRALADSLQVVPSSIRAEWQPRDGFERCLREIWKAVLGHGEFGPEDSFFDLGGNSLLALELARRIQDELGINIGGGAVFRHPSVRQQAELAAAGGASVGTAVVPLQEGGTGIPIYGICGIHLYSQLAKCLRPRRSFYGVFVPEELHGTEGTGAVSTEGGTSKALAEEYYRRIVRHRPEGAFTLLGFCFGGMIAYEIAILAARDGREVSSVVLVDSVLWTKLRRRQFVRAWKLVQRAWRWCLPGSRPSDRTVTEGEQPVDTRGAQLFKRALLHVPSGRFSGRCIMIGGSPNSSLLDTWKVTPTLGWDGYFGDGSVSYTLDGAHDAMLLPPVVAQVAAILGPILH